MIIETIQSFIRRSGIAPETTNRWPASRLAPSGGGVGWLKSLRQRLQEASRLRRQALEERRAIAHLHAMTDAQLRDIGVHRGDIEYAVRHGRTPSQPDR